MPSFSKLAPDHFFSDENGIMLFPTQSVSLWNFSLIATKVALLSSSAEVKAVRAFSSCSLLLSPYGITSTSSIQPSVIVPVLSRHRTSTLARVSIQ